LKASRAMWAFMVRRAGAEGEDVVGIDLLLAPAAD
jgi:hypothetical protein